MTKTRKQSPEQTALKVLGLTTGQLGSMYRLDQPVRALRERGHTARTLLPLRTSYTGMWPGQEPTTLLAQDIMFAHEKLERVWADCFASPDYPVVMDVDNAYWDMEPTRKPQWRPAHFDRLHWALARVDAVITTNAYLADKLAIVNPAVTVIPNFIDDAVLCFERPRRPRLTVGWMGATGHAGDFRYIQELLTEFFRLEPDVDAHFIGDDHRTLIGRPDARYSPGTTTDACAYWNAIDFDIGIAPIADTEFNRCRSHIKALEYGALGIPVVASSVGPYRDFVQHGVTGFLVRNNHEWVTALRTLVNDEQLGLQMRQAARDLAASQTIRANVERYERVMAVAANR